MLGSRVNQRPASKSGAPTASVSSRNLEPSLLRSIIKTSPDDRVNDSTLTISVNAAAAVVIVQSAELQVSDLILIQNGKFAHRDPRTYEHSLIQL